MNIRFVGFFFNLKYTKLSNGAIANGTCWYNYTLMISSITTNMFSSTIYKVNSHIRVVKNPIYQPTY
jgi:hypothetical protein